MWWDASGGQTSAVQDYSWLRWVLEATGPIYSTMFRGLAADETRGLNTERGSYRSPVLFNNNLFVCHFVVRGGKTTSGQRMEISLSASRVKSALNLLRDSYDSRAVSNSLKSFSSNYEGLGNDGHHSWNHGVFMQTWFWHRRILFCIHWVSKLLISLQHKFPPIIWQRQSFLTPLWYSLPHP